jgi:cytidine deaminase
MKIIQEHSQFKVYQNVDTLEKHYVKIISKAISALELSYAPYSKFKVGAALLLENEIIVMGANQENASYPLCMCAERVALYNASILYPQQNIIAIAVTAAAEDGKILDPIPPCGACRQVIAEYEQRQHAPIDILLKGGSKEIILYNGISGLLPKSFDGSYLP